MTGIVTNQDYTTQINNAFNVLKYASPQQLQVVAQECKANPQSPEALALSMAMQFQQEMRQPSPPPPQGTVIDKQLAQLAPQGPGIGAVAPNQLAFNQSAQQDPMHNAGLAVAPENAPQQMAAGGIVALAHGGPVRGFSGEEGSFAQVGSYDPATGQWSKDPWDYSARSPTDPVGQLITAEDIAAGIKHETTNPHYKPRHKLPAGTVATHWGAPSIEDVNAEISRLDMDRMRAEAHLEGNRLTNAIRGGYDLNYLPQPVTPAPTDYSKLVSPTQAEVAEEGSRISFPQGQEMDRPAHPESVYEGAKTDVARTGRLLPRTQRQGIPAAAPETPAPPVTQTRIHGVDLTEEPPARPQGLPAATPPPETAEAPRAPQGISQQEAEARFAASQNAPAVEATEAPSYRERYTKFVESHPKLAGAGRTVASLGGKVLTTAMGADAAGDIYDVYSDPSKNAGDVANQLIGSAIRGGSSLIGGTVGGSVGLLGGGVGAVPGAIVGGAGGYEAGAYGVKALRRQLGLPEADPSETSHGGYHQQLEKLSQKGGDLLSLARHETPKDTQVATPSQPPASSDELAEAKRVANTPYKPLGGGAGIPAAAPNTGRPPQGTTVANEPPRHGGATHTNAGQVAPDPNAPGYTPVVKTSAHPGAVAGEHTLEERSGDNIQDSDDSPEAIIARMDRLRGDAYKASPEVQSAIDKAIGEANTRKGLLALVTGAGTMMAANTQNVGKALGEGLVAGANTYQSAGREADEWEKLKLAQQMAEDRGQYDLHQANITEYMKQKAEAAKRQDELQKALLVEKLRARGKEALFNLKQSTPKALGPLELPKFRENVENHLRMNDVIYMKLAKDPAAQKAYVESKIQEKLADYYSGGAGGGSPGRAPAGGRYVFDPSSGQMRVM